MPFPELSVALRHDSSMQGLMTEPYPAHVGVDRADPDSQTRRHIRVSNRVLGEADESKGDPRLSWWQLRPNLTPKNF
jgi:hypothetical protein